MTTMQVEHDAGNIHLSAPMQDDAKHPFRVAMTDGGAMVIMPVESGWMQSIVLHGMRADTMDTAAMGRMFAACWEMAECCRNTMDHMRTMTGQMATIVCGNCTISLTM